MTRSEAIEAAAREILAWDPAAAPCEPRGMSIMDAQDLMAAALALPTDPPPLPDVDERHVFSEGGDHPDWRTIARHLHAALSESLRWHAIIGREGLTPDNREAWHAHMRDSRAALDLMPKDDPK